MNALANNDYQFPIGTDLDYYGPEAKATDVDDYAEFAEQYLTNLVGQTVTTYRVQRYDRTDQAMYDLRQEVWEAYCSQ